MAQLVEPRRPTRDDEEHEMTHTAQAELRGGDGYRPARKYMRVERRAQGLGWFSVGLGIAQLASPAGMAALTGVGAQPRSRATMVTLGLREIANGVGILRAQQPAAWLWMRVAGDVVDMALLAKALMTPKRRNTESSMLRNVASLAAVTAVTVMDALTAIQLTRAKRAEKRVGTIKAITVNVPPDDIARLWREHATVPPEAIVRFNPAPAGRGTEVKAEIKGATLRTLKAVDDALRRFKQVVETGEIVKSDASVHKGLHPAQPSKAGERGEHHDERRDDRGRRARRGGELKEVM
jgi:hypothetical protein